jgi:ketosteroid isomerase-like protein
MDNQKKDGVMSAKEGLEKWHGFVKSQDMAELSDLLTDDAVFYSPVVHTPQEGKAITTMYLMGAAQVLGNSDFTYVREVVDGENAVLEFTGVVDGITINGVDMIRFNEDGKIVEFKVMIRPLKAINLLHQKMGEMLQQLAGQ